MENLHREFARNRGSKKKRKKMEEAFTPRPTFTIVPARILPSPSSWR